MKHHHMTFMHDGKNEFTVIYKGNVYGFYIPADIYSGMKEYFHNKAAHDIRDGQHEPYATQEK